MVPPDPAASTALLTDRYELTMLTSALRDGTADRHCVFELFTRRLTGGRRYGVVAGIGRLVDAIERFRFDEATVEWLQSTGAVDRTTAEALADYRFTGDIEGYPEGELYFPGSPVLTVSGSFREAVVLETLVLSILNHDSAVAGAAARMVSAAGDRPLIEMGSRRTHEIAAMASARAAYLAGFASTSNLAAGRAYGIPTAGTSAHSFTLLHDSEADAFAAQLAALGHGTTLLVDTYDITAGIEAAVGLAGTGLGAIRIDSGDLGVLARQAREQLDALGARSTRIVASGDLDEYAIAALAAAPVDVYGAGTAVVTGSGVPTAGMVYKLVEVDGRPVAKRSEHKASRGGRKTAYRRHKATGTAVEEVVLSAPSGSAGRSQAAPALGAGDRMLQIPIMAGGRRVEGLPDLNESREHLRQAMVTIPWDGLKLSAGDPAIPVVFPDFDAPGRVG